MATKWQPSKGGFLFVFSIKRDPFRILRRGILIEEKQSEVGQVVKKKKRIFLLGVVIGDFHTFFYTINHLSIICFYGVFNSSKA